MLLTWRAAYCAERHDRTVHGLGAALCWQLHENPALPCWQRPHQQSPLLPLHAFSWEASGIAMLARKSRFHFLPKPSSSMQDYSPPAKHTVCHHLPNRKDRLACPRHQHSPSGSQRAGRTLPHFQVLPEAAQDLSVSLSYVGIAAVLELPKACDIIPTPPGPTRTAFGWRG